MTVTTLLFRPIDVLYLRGNRLFGGPGDHGDALMPPWPSVFTGAVLSRALADAGRLSEAARDKSGPRLVEEMFGRFSLRWMALADEGGRGRLFFPLSADLAVRKDNGLPLPERIAPVPGERFSGCSTSLPDGLPEHPVLRTKQPGKAEGGYWLTLAGLEKHLASEGIHGDDLVATKKLWKLDPRLGIAMDPKLRTAEEGRIYTAEAVALGDNIGFVCAFSHEKGDVPRDGLVRLGGDGRGAEIMEYPYGPPALGRPESGWKRFRMILSTPCPSTTGWFPPGVGLLDGGYILRSGELIARLVCAAVPRYEVISGWNVAKHVPKPAVRMIPAGSVYWFEVQEGDSGDLLPLWESGLLFDDAQNSGRWREGFGRVWFGTG